MRVVHAIAFVFLVFAASTSSIAASVEVVQGKVSLNRGGGYAQFSGVTQAKAGDLVMASAGGRARVVYGDGCILEVDPGKVVTVPQDQMCNPGALGANTGTYVLGGLAIAGGVTAVILLTQDGASP